MRKQLTICLTAALLLSILAGCVREENLPAESETPERSESVVLYAAMRENVLEALKTGFEKAYPEVELTYYNAATNTVLSRIRSEAQAGQVAADVLWVGDDRDYEEFKELDILRQYTSPQVKTAVDERYKDPEGYYVAGRLAAIGIAVNNDLVPSNRRPKTWLGMVDPEWDGQIAIVDPSLSVAADYWACAMLTSENKDYGAYYVRRLKRSECHLESSFSSLLRKVQAGERAMGACPDYLAEELIQEGANITFLYPTDMVAVGTPLALVKDSANMENGQLLYDYLLSREGQQILADGGLVSVRNDVDQRSAPDAIAAMAMDCDVKKLTESRDKAIAEFNEILGGKERTNHTAFRRTIFVWPAVLFP